MQAKGALRVRRSRSGPDGIARERVPCAFRLRPGVSRSATAVRIWDWLTETRNAESAGPPSCNRVSPLTQRRRRGVRLPTQVGDSILPAAAVAALRAAISGRFLRGRDFAAGHRPNRMHTRTRLGGKGGESGEAGWQGVRVCGASRHGAALSRRSAAWCGAWVRFVSSDPSLKPTPTAQCPATGAGRRSPDRTRCLPGSARTPGWRRDTLSSPRS